MLLSNKATIIVGLKEHRRATFSGNRDVSAVAEHVMDTGHNIEWDGARVLDSCGLLRQRLLLESWYVQCEQHSMNRERGPLPSIYCALAGQ